MKTKNQRKLTRYSQIIERIFLEKYKDGITELTFMREDIARIAKKIRIKLPKNLGDVIYSFRYRAQLPESIKAKAPSGCEWVIRPAGRSKYIFVATSSATIQPTVSLVETKIPDATPGIIAMYALTDEQALLAKLRYNRLIDVFTGVTCYSLQSHLRTFVDSIGQLETDEIYVGVDKRGIHYVFPVQAKGAKDRISVVQIEQDMAMCSSKFPNLICRPIAAQFMKEDLIALFELEQNIIALWLKSIGSRKWEFLRKLPYFESWLQCEISSYISANVSQEYSVKGFDIPAVTKNPIPGRRSWYPDLLIFWNPTQTFIWLELKVVSLERELIKRRITLSRYRGEILKTWCALNAFSLNDTLSLWRRHRTDQQLKNIVTDPVNLTSTAERNKHFGAMLIVSTGLKEGPNELLSDKLETIHEKIERSLFNEFESDWLILFGKHLINF